MSRLNEVIEFRAHLDSESDRGCALMAAAFLDGELERQLRQFVVDNTHITDDIFGQSRPIGTFSSRIDLAYLLGLIGSDAHRDLHLIRKIRNSFGHTHTPLTFEDESIASRCREMKNHFRVGHATVRQLFASTAVGILSIIHAGMNTMTRISECGNPDFQDVRKKINEHLLASNNGQGTSNEDPHGNA